KWPTSIASESGSPLRDCVLPLLCPSPRDLASRGLVTEERRAKHRGDQIVQEEQQLRAEAGAVAASPIERDDGFGRHLPYHGDVGETRLDGRCGVLAARAVKPELDEGHPLVQRLVLGRCTIEAARQIERAILDRKAPVQGFDARRQDCIKSPSS